MGRIKQLVLMQLRLLLKMNILRIGIIGIIALIVGFSLYLQSAGVDMIFYMQQVGNYSYYICAVFTIICFLFLTYAKRSQLEETLCSISPLYKYCPILTLIIIMLVISFVMFSMILINVINNNGIDLLFSTYIPSFFLNVFFSLCICLFMTVLISLIPHYLTSGIVLIVFIMIMSPLFHLGDEIIMKVLQPFHFLYQSDEWSVDYMYGLKDELYRWFIVLGYIFAIVGSIAISMIKKYKRIGIVVTLCLYVGCMGMSFRPQSVLDNNRSQTELNKQKTLTDITYKDYQKVDYKFEDYDMNIKLDNILYVDLSLVLNSQIAQTEYIFTLYSGYDIKELTSSYPCRYERNNNIVKVIFDKPTQFAKISMKYQGYHPMFYSNNQAVSLPGYFPWYPMIGELQIVYKTEDGNVFGYNQMNRIDSTYITLQIENNYPIVSNLDQKEENYFEGNADSMTLVGGILEEGDDLFIDVFPAKYNQKFQKEDELKNLHEEYDKTLKMFELCHLDQSLIKNKKIIIPGKSTSYFGLINKVVIFDNYMIVQEGHITFEDILKDIFHDMRMKSEIINHFILFSDDINKEKENYIELCEFFGMEDKKLRRLKSIIEYMSDDEYVKEFIDYGTGEKVYQDDNEFLNVMEDKYVKD